MNHVGHYLPVFDLAITRDGQTLISAGGDDTLIWGLHIGVPRSREKG